MPEAPNGLQLLGSETFRPHQLYRVVTFLNQCLKDHGLVFGLSRVGQDYSLQVYQGHPVPNQESRPLPRPKGNDC